MGRTLAPYSMQIDMVLQRFGDFRRGLRKSDQAIFDRLIRFARLQLQSGVMASSPNPFDSMAMTMLLEMQKQLDEQAAILRRLEQNIERLDRRGD